MRNSFWHNRWQQNEIAFHQNDVNQAFSSYWHLLNLPSRGTVLVPLCGKSYDMIWLRDHGYKVIGVELSPIAAKDFFDENALSPTVTRHKSLECWAADDITFYVGDFFAVEATDMEAVDGVYDRAALIALPPPMREDYADHINAIVPPGTPTLLITFEYPQHEMEGPPFSVTKAEVQRLYEHRYTVTQLISKDVLNEIPRFRDKGLSSLREVAYHLTPL